ncbi:MAG: exodeoxyribonuclease VII small subunit [Ruminococcaceae bacterium]|nr:exodeoxyribonuclease VII small subunit [Oscillospiraceae bacterium]
MKFEDALTYLDDIVKKLEANSLSLDESLEAFDTAVKLVKFCNQKLELAEQKVRILTEGDDGSVTDMPFENISDAT